MRKFIEHMRNQPEDRKQGVAMIIAFTVSAFIFLAWITSFLGGNDKAQLAGTADVVDQNNPFETLKEDFQTLLNNN